MSDWHPVAITRMERPTPRVVSVFFPQVIGPFEAGSHVDVRLTADDGYQAERSYSIASAPGAAELELAIEALDEGEVSPYFHDVAQPGDMFEVRGPIGGHFNWRAQDGGPILLVGGGSGVVPLMSMVRHRSAAAPGVEMMLVYSARTWEEVIFADELAALQDDKFRWVVATTRGPKRRDGDLDKRLDRESLAALMASWGRKPIRAYVCGSNPFAEAVTNGLVDDGLSPDIIRVERYGG